MWDCNNKAFDINNWQLA